jgi:glucose/sorbosone dehydrogenase
MSKIRFRLGLVILALCCLSAPVFAAISLVPILSGLSNPVFVGNAGDGTNRLFVVEQDGVIRVMQPGASTATVFLDIHSRVLVSGERGLLGLAFHPSYESNGRFFVYYTRDPDGTIVVAEYRVSTNPNQAGTAETVLFTIPHPAGNHNGGMLAFGPDGYLYVGVGDGGGGNDPDNNAQNVNTLLGKILRIDVNTPGAAYASPPTNPYYGATAGRDEIFSIGWRNPWRFSFDRQTGQQWVADVGQGSREEVDTPIVSGGNYGWRVYEGTACTGLDPLCTPANYIFPLFDYQHTGGRCSITGGYVYRGTMGTLPAGTYIYADFCTGEIFQWNGAAQSVLLDTSVSISSFGEDEQGELYVVAYGGTLSKIVPAASTSGILDIDASITATRYDALTDGLLAIRYMFGLRGSTMTTGALGGTASRTDPVAIADYMAANRSAFDIDNNGSLDALTDGLLILRYLLGLRGAALTQNAIATDALRNTPALIEGHLLTLIP